MRVLLEGWKLARDHDWGGVESYWKQLVPALLETKPEPTHFSLVSAFLHPRHRKTMELCRNKGARLRHFWAKPDHLLSLGRLGFRSEWLGGEHDLVHAGGPVWPFPTRARLVVTCHDLMFEHHPQFLSPRTAQRMREDARNLVDRACLWIGISETARQDLMETYGVPKKRTAVAHPGVQPAFFAAGDRKEIEGIPSTQESGAFFLFLGSHEPKKNLVGLLQSYALARDKGLRTRLVLAGRLPDGFSLPKEMQTDGIERLGFVPADRLPSLVGEARALVLPSWHEGFGMPVLEAMAAGTAVICSHEPALLEASGNAALTFEPADTEKLAELLLSIDGDPAQRQNLRRAGREHAAAFTWQRCAHQVHQAYEAALLLPR